MNSVQVKNDLVVGSADVKALYPSLNIDFTIKKVCDVFFESDDIQVEGVDYEEVGLYLAINTEPEVLQRSNISDASHKEIQTRQKTNNNSKWYKERKDKRLKPWNHLKSKPMNILKG